MIQLIVPQSAKCFYSTMVKNCALTGCTPTFSWDGWFTPMGPDSGFFAHIHFGRFDACRLERWETVLEFDRFWLERVYRLCWYTWKYNVVYMIMCRPWSRKKICRKCVEYAKIRQKEFMNNLIYKQQGGEMEEWDRDDQSPSNILFLLTPTRSKRRSASKRNCGWIKTE